MQIFLLAKQFGNGIKNSYRNIANNIHIYLKVIQRNNSLLGIKIQNLIGVGCLIGAKGDKS